jgi:hypothetical protein
MNAGNPAAGTSCKKFACVSVEDRVLHVSSPNQYRLCVKSRQPANSIPIKCTSETFIIPYQNRTYGNERNATAKRETSAGDTPSTEGQQS